MCISWLSGHFEFLSTNVYIQCYSQCSQLTRESGASYMGWSRSAPPLCNILFLTCPSTVPSSQTVRSLEPCTFGLPTLETRLLYEESDSFRHRSDSEGATSLDVLCPVNGNTAVGLMLQNYYFIQYLHQCIWRMFVYPQTHTLYVQCLCAVQERLWWWSFLHVNQGKSCRVYSHLYTFKLSSSAWWLDREHMTLCVEHITHLSVSSAPRCGSKPLTSSTNNSSCSRGCRQQWRLLSPYTERSPVVSLQQLLSLTKHQYNLYSAHRLYKYQEWCAAILVWHFNSLRGCSSANRAVGNMICWPPPQSPYPNFHLLPHPPPPPCMIVSWHSVFLYKYNTAHYGTGYQDQTSCSRQRI